MRASLSSSRWLAGTTALAGLIVLLSTAARDQAQLGAVLPAMAMFVGGAVLFVRMSTPSDTWERRVHGPTARRFLAIGLAVAALLTLITVLLMLHFLLTPAA